ncbi:riboflavin biosynthesis protein RibD [bacterium (candidate division B38) B3_B38]|nr:MAG: riboflavin biosynthesis protein RibD [bacterium (candidate division B38) B3_B38]
MRRALELAAKGKGFTSPNPMVGAVIVKKGKIIGEGFHCRAGDKHAEIVALENCVENPREGTLYLNLEPCCHKGRTPPCVEAIVKAGIKRVVAAMADPNPLVKGKGFELLRQRGIEVEVGLCQQEAEELNEKFIFFIKNRRPFVMIKAALSLDGKIATPTGKSRWLSSREARRYVHQLRQEYDAIMVGINTVLRDNPRLTVRLPGAEKKEILRVVLDSKLRIPIQYHLVREKRGGEVLIFTTPAAPAERIEQLRSLGVGVVIAKEKEGRVDLNYALKQLAKKGIISLLIEGGSEVFATALKEKLINKVLFIYAPKIIGGRDSISLFGGEGKRELASAYKLSKVRSFRLGPDVAIEGYLK